jgi:hypothetical protein
MGLLNYFFHSFITLLGGSEREKKTYPREESKIQGWIASRSPYYKGITIPIPQWIMEQKGGHGLSKE